MRGRWEKKTDLVINWPSCTFSWCFSFPWEGNSLTQPLKEQLCQKIRYCLAGQMQIKVTVGFASELKPLTEKAESFGAHTYVLLVGPSYWNPSYSPDGHTKKRKSRSQKQCTKIQTCSGQRLRLKKETFPRLEYSISFLLVLVNSGHVVLQAGTGDKGLRAAISQTPGGHSGLTVQSDTQQLEKIKIYNPFISKGALLVWFFPAVTELMSGELIASTKALVTVLTGEWFLRSEWKHQTLTQHFQVINSHKHNINFYNTPLDPDLFFSWQLFAFILLGSPAATYQSCVFAKMSL